MRRCLFFLLALVLLSTPSWAYTVYLKDGSKIISKEKYRIEDGTAYIVLLNGTETFIDAGQIDIERTDEANQTDYGTALVVEGSEIRQVQRDRGVGGQRERRLSDIIASRGGVTRELPQAEDEAEDGEAVLPRTEAGWIDLRAVSRRAFEDAEVGARLAELLTEQGIKSAEVFQGTEPDRPLVNLVTGSETAVFRGILATCNALMQIVSTNPGAVSAVELVMATPEGERAGQFVLQPETARQLLNKELDLTEFFIAHVEF